MNRRASLIEVIQALSKDEGQRQPSPAEWLRQQDAGGHGGEDLRRDVNAFLSTMEREGWAPALAFLNAVVPHRYTGAYRIKGDLFENVALHDKHGEVRPEYLAIVPFEASFCQFVLRDGVFVTHNSGADERLEGHPYQGVMISYHGVPIANGDGDLLGTLCHFDLAEFTLPAEEFELLRLAGRALDRFL